MGKKLIIWSITLTLVLVAGKNISLAQEQDSINKKILVYELFNQIFSKSPQKVSPIQPADSIPLMPFQVMGWYTQSSGDTTLGYNFDVLTTILFQGAELTMRRGRLNINEPIWQSNQVKRLLAQAENTKSQSIYTISIQDINVFNSIISDAVAQSVFFDQISKTLALNPSLDGICLHISNLSKVNDMLFLNFIESVSSLIQKDKKSLFITLPKIPQYDQQIYKHLDQIVDALLLMALDYNMPKDTKGPMAPLNVGSLNIENSMRGYTDLGVSKNKLTAILPYEGTKWQGREVLSQLGKLPYKQIMSEIGDKNKMITYPNDSNYAFFSTGLRQIRQEYFFDDPITFKKKFEWIKDHDFGGIGMYALGFDEGRPELWQMLSTLNKKDSVYFNWYQATHMSSDSINQTTAKSNTIDYEALEAEAKEKYEESLTAAKLMLRQKEVVFTIGVMLPIFIGIAFLVTILQSSFFEKILIHDFSVFLKSVAFLAILVVVCVLVASFVLEKNPDTAERLQTVDKETVLVSGTVIRQVLKFGLFGLLVLLALSSKAFLNINRDLP